MASGGIDVASRQLQGLAREERGTLGHRDHLRLVILVGHRDHHRRAAEVVAEIDPDALGLGQQPHGLGADPTRMAGDGVAGRVELSVCGLDRMVHLAHRPESTPTRSPT